MFRIITPLTRYLPLRALDLIGEKAADLSFHLMKKRRKIVEQNLLHILGKHAGKVALRRYLRNTFRNFTCCLIDFLRMPYLSSAEIGDMVESQGIENAFTALQLKKGLMVITLHVGNWDLGCCHLSLAKLPVVAVAEDTAPDMLEFYRQRRELFGAKIISAKSSSFAFAKPIKENRVLILASDRDITNSGVRTTFFDGFRSVPTGPERLAKALKVPITFGYMVLNSKKSFRYLVVIEPHRFIDKDESLTELMVKKFEQIIRQYPDQWFAFQHEWLN